MRRPVLIAGLAAGVACVAEVRAQAPGEGAITPADRNAVATCLRDSTDAPRACIGTIAVVCIREGGQDRRESEIACSRREARVWRERLDNAARSFAERLDSGARSRLAALQRSWEGYTSQKCAFAGDIQPPARAPATQAACELRETALRSLEVERLAQRPTPNRPGRPEIFR